MVALLRWHQDTPICRDGAPLALKHKETQRNTKKHKEGPPSRAALPLSSRGPVASAIVPPYAREPRWRIRPPRPEPRQRRGSSSRMPATAAIDNETLDHLLSGC